MQNIWSTVWRAYLMNVIQKMIIEFWSGDATVAVHFPISAPESHLFDSDSVQIASFSSSSSFFCALLPESSCSCGWKTKNPDQQDKPLLSSEKAASKVGGFLIGRLQIRGPANWGSLHNRLCCVRFRIHFRHEQLKLCLWVFLISKTITTKTIFSIYIYLDNAEETGWLARAHSKRGQSSRRRRSKVRKLNSTPNKFVGCLSREIPRVVECSLSFLALSSIVKQTITLTSLLLC